MDHQKSDGVGVGKNCAHKAIGLEKCQKKNSCKTDGVGKNNPSPSPITFLTVHPLCASQF